MSSDKGLALGLFLLLPLVARAAPGEVPGRFWVRLALDTVGACAGARGDVSWGECLAERGEWWAERALKLRSLPITDGVSLVRSSRGTARSAGSLDPLSRMLETFSLQLDLPAVLTDPQSLARVVEEGRGKLKKYWKPLMLIVTAIKAYLFFTALATLALFIGKALLVSKVALAIALSALYKKYFGGKKETIEVIKVQHHSQSHQSEGHHHQEGYSSSSEWESGSSGGYSSYGGGGGGGGEEYGSSGGGGGGYDKRRADEAVAPSGTATAGAAGGSDLAYRGHRRDGSATPGVRWSPREEPAASVPWKGDEKASTAGDDEGGREERSSVDCWSDGFRRRKCPKAMAGQ